MRGTLLFLSIFFIAFNCKAQQLAYKAFTVNDGLPSNYIYKCVEDDKGFLWVATDAGIARFDGKRFQVFTTREGLPDNEVLAVVKENDGTIWVNCFKQSPAFFDEVQNRFINAKEDSNLAKAGEGTALMFVYPLQQGGVMFCNENGSYIFRNRKLVEYNELRHINFIVQENKDGRLIRWANLAVSPGSRISTSRLYTSKGAGFIDSLALRENVYNGTVMACIDDGTLYNLYNYHNVCFVYSNFRLAPLRCKQDSITLPESCYYYGFTKTWVIFYGSSGMLYVYDKKTLKPLFNIGGDYAPNALYNDSHGNIWISTIDKGLIVYKAAHFNNMPLPPGFTHTNFMSISRTPGGTLLAGNFYGEILEANGKDIKIKRVIKSRNGAFRQRKILVSQNKIFTFSEMGVFVNYTKRLSSPLTALVYAKTAISYNDSIILIGRVGNFQKINTITNEVTTLNQPGKRTTAFAKGKDGMIYSGSTDGLYKYDYEKNTTTYLGQKDSLLTERITGLAATDDSLLWVATAGSGVMAVKHDKVIAKITGKDGLISGAARSITAAGPGRVWLGTAVGISVITYRLQGGNINYTIKNLTVNDGLTSNVINEMLYDNDTVYVTTADGITIIPVNFSTQKFDIPVQLVRVSINQRDTVISTRYNLAYGQHNIQIQLAGIELSGHFEHLQYTLDGNRDWINLGENILTLQLNSGDHAVQVRAVDVNGNISKKMLTVEFNIATPFWKSPWFWLITALVLQAILFYIISRWLKRKRELKLEREIAGVQTAALEQQAFTSLMNPHFLFNALNSIQHYINVQDRKNANRYLSDFASLIRKNFEAAQKSFIPLEQEMENIKIYLRLEQMRFNNRFSYEINVAENLDLDHWMIPTMMLQPFLENALLHGIMPSACEGVVRVAITEKDDNLVIIITDNGIGIANSMALKHDDGHHSLGMELIQKRIAALSRFGIISISINISPAFEDEKNPGNKITLLIPAGLYKAWLQAQH